MNIESFCFRAARTPIGWRECHAPEPWARVLELNTDLGNSRLSRVAIDHRADDFLISRNVTHDQLLAGADRFLQHNERAMSADHFGLRALRKCRAIRLFAEHDDSHTKEDSLAPPLAWSSTGACDGRGHNPHFFLRAVACMTGAKCRRKSCSVASRCFDTRAACCLFVERYTDASHLPHPHEYMMSTG